MEISRARDRAELVTDDAKALREQLEAVTGERIAALEAIGEMKREAPDKGLETAPAGQYQPERDTVPDIGQEFENRASPTKMRETTMADRGRGKDIDLGM